ncbi:MAG TPA: hypothetical protein VH394_14160 [Thermoanaerobaculia bacterium]|jgi:hypothetical protein|nr:hypothetical protein [Thermoanaerobaculia bacterium]
MRFEVKDLIIKIETPEGHRVLGFDLGDCANKSDCGHGSGCRIFSGPCQATECRKTATDQGHRMKSGDREVLVAALQQALERLAEEVE